MPCRTLLPLRFFEMCPFELSQETRCEGLVKELCLSLESFFWSSCNTQRCLSWKKKRQIFICLLPLIESSFFQMEWGISLLHLVIQPIFCSLHLAENNIWCFRYPLNHHLSLMFLFSLLFYLSLTLGDNIPHNGWCSGEVQTFFSQTPLYPNVLEQLCLLFCVIHYIYFTQFLFILILNNFKAFTAASCICCFSLQPAPLGQSEMFHFSF